MRYFIYWLASLVKPFIAIFPLCLLVPSCFTESERKESDAPHPYWLYKLEGNLDEIKGCFTGFGRKGLLFCPNDDQKPFNVNDKYLEFVGDTVHILPEAGCFFVTPNCYGSLTEDIKCRGYSDDKKDGMTVASLEKWLAIDSCEGAIILCDDKFGFSEDSENMLRDKKANGEIEDYKTLRSKQAVEAHNTYVKERKKVFTVIHIAG